MRVFENADHWDQAALHYERTAHPFTARFAEDAAAHVPLTPETYVLDVAAGTGALALAAARKGARVLATDFSRGMVDRIAAVAPPNVEARVMDGQKLELPESSFDAAFSIFGVIMFPDWRRGLSEMARVTRPNGYGVFATWRHRGAATFLLLGDVRRKLFPDRESMAMPSAVEALSDPRDFARELIAAGYRDPKIEEVTHDYELDVTALAEPDTLFGMSSDWTGLSDREKSAVVEEVQRIAAGEPVLKVPSTALIGVARR